MTFNPSSSSSTFITQTIGRPALVHVAYATLAIL